MVLTTGLSKPFRHLERYAGLMQEVEQHLSDDHPDRGDTQRSIGFYKNIAVYKFSALSISSKFKETHLGYIILYVGRYFDSLNVPKYEDKKSLNSKF